MVRDIFQLEVQIHNRCMIISRARAPGRTHGTGYFTIHKFYILFTSFTVERLDRNSALALAWLIAYLEALNYVIWVFLTYGRHHVVNVIYIR